MGDVHLVVNGRRYGGWKAVRVTRSMESVAGSFDIVPNDRWGEQEEPWSIAEEDACRVQIDGETVIDGFVDRPSISLSGQDRSLSFSGRDRAAALVDCSVMMDKWSFRKSSALEVIRKLAEPFGIRVSIQEGLQRKLPDGPLKFSVSPGEKAFEAIARAAQMAGVLVVSDGAGGIFLTRAGAARASTSLVQGKNILAASVEYDATERFRRYIVITQIGGTDNASGEVTSVIGYAIDEGVRRLDRVLVIRPETGVTVEYARLRADWEARVRAARSETVSITVQGWRQKPGGPLWPINALVPVDAPAVRAVGDFLITQTDFSLDDGGGEVTGLRLVRPDAFDPEPEATVAPSKVKVPGGAATGRWAELLRGAL